MLDVSTRELNEHLYEVLFESLNRTWGFEFSFPFLVYKFFPFISKTERLFSWGNANLTSAGQG